MKHLAFIFVLAALFTNFAFASDLGETSTDCPMMKEENARHNPKANLGSQVKAKSKRPTATAQ